MIGAHQRTVHAMTFGHRFEGLTPPSTCPKTYVARGSACFHTLAWPGSAQIPFFLLEIDAMKLAAFTPPPTTARRPLALWSVALGLALVLAHVPAFAIKITVTDKDKKPLATLATCTSPLGDKPFKDCKSTASLNETSLTGDDGAFKKSFDAWNKGLAADKKWSLSDGGKLPGGEFKVTIFRAKAAKTLGGMDMKIEWDYAGADKSKFQWAQGLLDNYLTGSPPKIVDPFYEMDNLGSTTSPLYPYQFDDRHFEDGPEGPWPNTSFLARTFLSQVDAATRKLTIYEGVSYGFELSATPTAVPEPTGLGLALAGIVLLMARRGLQTRTASLGASLGGWWRA
jgi:hypothetical protein